MARFKPNAGQQPISPPSALETLYRNSSRWLVARLRGRFGDNEAEDIVQETYIRMTRVDLGEVRHPRALLLKVAVNAGNSRARRAAARGQVTSLALDCDAADLEIPSPSDQDENQLLKEIVLGLPLPYREVFLLSRFAGMTYSAIAAHLGISVATVERRLAKAVALCAAQLRD